jgi:cytochrome b561
MATLRDSSNGYGWISIALHWTTAAGILAMWVIGSMSQAATDLDYGRLVNLHMTTGAILYVLLWTRIVWRIASGHPGPLPRQNRVFFAIGKVFHYAFLGAIAVMLVTGPLLVWTSGSPIEIAYFRIPSPFSPMPRIQAFLRGGHGLASAAILIGTALHVLGALKHVVVDRDGTLDKILVAHRDRV